MTSKGTYDNVRRAIIRIEKGRPLVIASNRKMSVAAVAEESGVSRSLIHRDMPDLLARIKGSINKTDRELRDAKHKELKLYMERNKELRDENEQLREHLRHLQSVNATLMLQNESLAKTNDDNPSVYYIHTNHLKT